MKKRKAMKKLTLRDLKKIKGGATTTVKGYLNENGTDRGQGDHEGTNAGSVVSVADVVTNSHVMVNANGAPMAQQASGAAAAPAQLAVPKIK